MFPNYQQCVRVSVKLMMTTTAAQEGVISMQNYENVGQYLRRIYHHLWSRINIMSSAGTRVDHWYHRPLPLLPLDLLVPDIWICLETAFGFVFENIYISPGFNFPYFRSSPLSISPCWMASYFPVKLPRKETIFGTVCTSKAEYSRTMCEIMFCWGEGRNWLFFGGSVNIGPKLAVFAKQRFGWWGPVAVSTCGASSDNRACRSLYICSGNPQVAENGQQVDN